MIGEERLMHGRCQRFDRCVGQALFARNIAARDTTLESVEGLEIAVKHLVRRSDKFVDLRLGANLALVERPDESHATRKHYRRADNHRFDCDAKDGTCDGDEYRRAFTDIEQPPPFASALSS